MSKRTSQRNPFWYLEGAVDETGQAFRVPVSRQPFRIGRDAGLELSLPSQVVSSTHAELSIEEHHLVVTDLGSTNGTFVNSIPVEGRAPVADGDILQFATLAFRVRMAGTAAIDALADSTATIDTRRTLQMAEDLGRLRSLLADRAVTQLFQPIVDLVEDDVLGYEVLGRGAFDGLPAGIHELFQLAQHLGAEVELSRILRQQAAAACAELHGQHLYFLNTHPTELLDDTLLWSLRDTRARWPDLCLAVEIHESAVTDLVQIRELQQELQSLDMLLVYDDFGAGQARLVELAEVPPAFLKFDRVLVHDVDRAPAARVRLLEGLATMALELDISIIAEGLERQEELELCRGLGFTYGQGYLLGRPAASEERDGLAQPPQRSLR